MTVPTMRRSTNTRLPRRSQSRFRRWPLVIRRLGAWAIEISLIVGSALVPYGIGIYARSNFTEAVVPLNPGLVAMEENIARVLAIPVGEKNRIVTPLTNLFWSGALVLPLIVAGSQLYLLARTGQTWPKRWFGLRVVTATGDPPGLGRSVLRETCVKWGMPLGSAYLIWRYSGAFPGLSILGGLAAGLLLAEIFSARFHPQRRAFHDRLAGTYVTDARRTFSPYSRHFQPSQQLRRTFPVQLEMSPSQPELDEDAAIAAIVLTPEKTWPRRSLWIWMRQHPGLTLLVVALAGMASVLGTFVGTQVYIQSQANHRDFKQQNNQTFLELVSRLNPSAASSPAERQGAILALGTLKEPQATQLLVDLLSQEETPLLIDAIQQALVSTGPDSIPYLRRLNQSLRNDLASLQYSNQQAYQLQALRQRATQRAIAKILTIYSGQLHAVDLSRTSLSQSTPEAAQFALVLDQIDLSGIQLRGTTLANASLQRTYFYGPGEDNRLGTFDDWIADLSGADLKDANLSGARLKQVSFQRTNLMRAILDRADLSEAKLIDANLSSARLIGANLHQAVLENASLTGADLANADCSHANFHSARLGQVSALGSQFQFANLSHSNWQGSDLSGADLRQVNLRKADLSSTNLASANLQQAQLQHAKLKNANLSLADLRGADLTGADFQGVDFFTLKPTQPDQFIQTPPTSSAIVKDVNFSKVRNLTAEQITYICENGGRHPNCQL